MAGSTWKLTVTSLNGSVDPVEVAVEAENWLSALRLARKELGQDGGMPPGASCVMSASGEVTILDAAQRLRYALTRVSTVPAAPVATERVSAPPAVSVATPQASAPAPENHDAAAPPPGAPRRSATIAYSPEESAEIRKQLAQPTQAMSPSPQAQPQAPAPAPALHAPAKPAFSPSLPSSLAAQPAPASAQPAAPSSSSKRSATVAYSPEESSEFRRQLQAAAQARSQRSASAEPDSASRPSVELGPQASAPAASASPSVAPSVARASEAPAAPVAPAAPPAQAPALGRRATVAYLQSPFAPGGELVSIHARDEAPSAASPLTYRERSYFAPTPLEPGRLEALLRSELETLMRELAQSPRGQFVNLAVFDHTFQGRPQRPPLATLQWKDWRGAPVFSMASAQALPSWRPTPAGGPPVATSFIPGAPTHPPGSFVPPAATPAAPSFVPHAAPAPAPFHPLAPQPPASQAPAPSHAPAPHQPPASQFPAPSHAPAPHQPPASQAPAPSHAPAPHQPPASQFPAPSHAPAPHQPPASQAPSLAPAQVPLPTSPAMVVPPPATARASALVTPAQGLANINEFGAEPTGDQDRRLAVAFEASQDLYFLATPVEGLEFAVKLLSDLVPSEAASACIYDINTDEFRFVALSGPGATERRAEAVPSSEGLLAAAVRSGKDTFIATDVENDPRYDPAVDGRVGLSVETLAYLPLQKGDNLLGLLQLINRKGRPNFSEADMAVAGYLASQLAEFLQSKRAGGRR